MAPAMITWGGFLVLVAIAVLFTGRFACAKLDPPRHTPVRFFFRGASLLAITWLLALLASRVIIQGEVDFTARKYGGHIAASRELEPVAFWLFVGMLYVIGLFMASFGTALLMLSGRDTAAGVRTGRRDRT